PTRSARGGAPMLRMQVADEQGERLGVGELGVDDEETVAAEESEEGLDLRHDVASGGDLHGPPHGEEGPLQVDAGWGRSCGSELYRGVEGSGAVHDQLSSRRFVQPSSGLCRIRAISSVLGSPSAAPRTISLAPCHSSRGSLVLATFNQFLLTLERFARSVTFSNHLLSSRLAFGSPRTTMPPRKRHWGCGGWL